MLIEQTLDKLNAMKLGAMADACRHQLRTANGRPASSASSTAGFAPPSCVIPPPSKPSTSPIPVSSTASRS